MAYSMTGFGRGEAASAGRAFTAEIRTVNHRYCDVSIKMPRTFLNFEERLRQAVTQKISRGKVDIYINYEEFGERQQNVLTDTSLAGAYIEAANSLKSRFNLRDEITLSTLLRIPDIVKIDGATPGEDEIWRLLGDAFHAALDAVAAMRLREGEKLAGDISAKLGALTGLVAQIKDRAPFVVSEYREKLNARLKELLDQNMPDENRIASEIVIYADKCGIDEEITRFLSHLEQAEKCISSTGPVGRKLDFILQEINREINTIGSKSNDLQINKIVVEIKTEAEKIREQIQNLE